MNFQYNSRPLPLLIPPGRITMLSRPYFGDQVFTASTPYAITLQKLNQNPMTSFTRTFFSFVGWTSTNMIKNNLSYKKIYDPMGIPMITNIGLFISANIFWNKDKMKFQRFEPKTS